MVVRHNKTIIIASSWLGCRLVAFTTRSNNVLRSLNYSHAAVMYCWRTVTVIESTSKMMCEIGILFGNELCKVELSAGSTNIPEDFLCLRSANIVFVD